MSQSDRIFIMEYIAARHLIIFDLLALIINIRTILRNDVSPITSDSDSGKPDSANCTHVLAFMHARLSSNVRLCIANPCLYYYICSSAALHGNAYSLNHSKFIND